MIPTGANGQPPSELWPRNAGPIDTRPHRRHRDRDGPSIRGRAGSGDQSLLTPSRPESESAGNERERIGTSRSERAARRAKTLVEHRVRFPAAPLGRHLSAVTGTLAVSLASSESSDDGALSLGVKPSGWYGAGGIEPLRVGHWCGSARRSWRCEHRAHRAANLLCNDLVGRGVDSVQCASVMSSMQKQHGRGINRSQSIVVDGYSSPIRAMWRGI
jgi:hypothetical protein